MGVAAHVPDVEPDRLQQPLDPVQPLAFVADTMDQQRLGDDVGYCHARIERAERVLEDVLDMPAKALQGGFVEGQHIHGAIAAVKDDLAIVGPDRAHDHLADRRLARAALADDCQRLPSIDRKADIVDGDHLAPLTSQPAHLAGQEHLAQASDLEDRSRSRCAALARHRFDQG